MAEITAPDHAPRLRRDRLDERAQHSAGDGRLATEHQDHGLAVMKVPGQLIEVANPWMVGRYVGVETGEELKDRLLPLGGDVCTGPPAHAAVAQRRQRYGGEVGEG